MATLYSQEKKNNLELYLNDVYEKECAFKIAKEEVEFIETGIETLVQDLVDKILTDDSFHKQISNLIDEAPFLIEEKYHEKSIAEVYFPIQSDSFLQRYVAENESQVKAVKSTIIKVGSFYDGTKNNFPDEFDFIFPLLGVRIPKISPYQYIVDFIRIEKTIYKHAKHTHYTSSSEKHEVSRELKFDKYIAIYGPAFKLRYIYSNGLGELRHIHVDLVPAAKIIDSNTLQWFVDPVREYVEPKTFREEILAAGSSLSVRGNLAFTEMEKHFMKNILSKKHVKVSQIIKYLLNGHGDGEKVQELFRYTEKVCYTSYHIKILIIYHHEACTNTDTENLGPCILQVLEELSKYEDAGELHDFTSAPIPSSTTPFELLPYLKSTVKTLQSMQITEGSYCYCYERHKIKSVSGQYLNTNTRRPCALL